MCTTDPLALHYARLAQAVGHMERVEHVLRPFFRLPYAYSEEIADQDISVMLNAKLGEPWLSHTEGHRDIIGRFPHRNSMLGHERRPPSCDGGFADSGAAGGPAGREPQRTQAARGSGLGND